MEIILGGVAMTCDEWKVLLSKFFNDIGSLFGEKFPLWWRYEQKNMDTNFHTHTPKKKYK